MTKRARPQRQKKIRRGFLGFFALAALLFLFLWNMRLNEIHIKGGEFYTEQELADYIFEKSYEKNFLYALLNDRFGEQKPIPFVEGYTMEFTGTSQVTVTVYEKNVVGYIDYMGSHMYFDKDGTVVESSREAREELPLITGLDFDYIVLYKPLPVENETAFTQILNLTQLIDKYELPVDKIYFDSRFNATLYMDDVRVKLGDKSDMEDKIAELHGMMTVLAGYSGELDLEDYDRAAMNPSYYFIKDESIPLEAVPETAPAGGDDSAGSPEA